MTKAAVSGLCNPFDSDAIAINENANVEKLLQDDNSCDDDPVEVFTVSKLLLRPAMYTNFH